MLEAKSCSMRRKAHGTFGDRDTFDAAHFFVRGEKQVDLALDRNAERIFEKRILPGVHVCGFGSQGDIFAFRESRGFGDGDRFRSAGLHAFASEAIRGSKSPGALGDDADADAERFGFGERANFAIFRGDVADANVHDARVGVGGAADFGGLEGPVSAILHFPRPRK